MFYSLIITVHLSSIFFVPVLCYSDVGWLVLCLEEAVIRLAGVEMSGIAGSIKSHEWTTFVLAGGV